MAQIVDRAGTETVESEASIVFVALIAAVTAPYRRTFKLYTWRPIKRIQAAGGNRDILIPLVKDWKADKYSELQSVQVAASICAGATLSTIPWTRNQNPVWAAEALWFSSLICSIWAVITSIQTRSILDDLPDKDRLNSALPDIEVQRMRRVILRYRSSPGLGYWAMLWIWQFPSMTMSYAWCTFLSGLTVCICTPFIRNAPWDNRHKTAIVYLAIGSVGLLTYLFSSVIVYVGEKDFERAGRENAGDLEAGRATAGAGRRHTGNAEDVDGDARRAVAFDNDFTDQLRFGAGGSGKAKQRLLI